MLPATRMVVGLRKAEVFMRAILSRRADQASHSRAGEEVISVPSVYFLWSRVFWPEDSPGQKTRDVFERRKPPAMPASAH